MSTYHVSRVAGDTTRELSNSGVKQVLMGYRGHRLAAVDPDWTPQPGMLYTQVRAISARINQNFDAWPSEELKKSYRTFLGKPVFINHNNDDPSRARGKVIAARYVEAGDDKYVEVIQEIDAARFPKLAKEIREGGLDSVSMGVEAGLTICSYCDNRATDEPEFCDHVKYHKGDRLPRKNTKTGKVEDVLIYENCYKLGFFELSMVFDPADETAVVSRVIAAGKQPQNRREAYEAWDSYDPDHKPKGPGKIRRKIQEFFDPDEILEDLEQRSKLRDFRDDYKKHKELVHVGSRRRLGYGEKTAPSDIDTLRDEDGDAVDDYQFVEPLSEEESETDEDTPFQHWIDSPEELRQPDLGQTKRLDREQEDEGLDTDRRVEDVEDIMSDDEADMAQPPQGRQAMARTRRTASDEEMIEQALIALEEAHEDAHGDHEEPDGDEDEYGEEPEDEYEEDDDEDEEEEEYEEGEYPEEEILDPRHYIAACRQRGARPTEEGYRHFVATVGRKASAGNRRGKGNSMGSLSGRGRVATRGRQRHYADSSGHVDGGPYGNDSDQGNLEEVYISQVPAAEPVAAPADDESNISNTEQTLVARRLQREIKARATDLQRYLTAYRRVAECDDNITEPREVNPALSGTDQQDLKGDFESVQPDDVHTQPKDASVRVFRAFDNWLQSTTGRTARQHGNANYIRRQAASYSKASGIPLEKMFPALDVVLRQTRKAERSAPMNRRRAEFDGETVAPDARIDVEAPVQNVTDADAQASQYDLGDYGDNAGDDIANPNTETNSQIWAPKEGNRKADGVAAVRYAEAYINAGLPCEDKWKLVAQAQTIRHATVVDRTRLLEYVAQTNATRARTQKVAAAVSRGTTNGIPKGLTAPRPTQRTAANDPADDFGLWF